MQIGKWTAGIWLWLLLCTSLGYGQGTTGAIFGTVTDPSGAAVVGAQVSVTEVATNFSRMTASDASGHYLVQYLPPGTYRVEATAPGFKKFVQAGIVLELDRRARVDVRFEVGAVTESVTVNADAPLVETATATLGRTVNNADIINLPLVNRNVYALLSLTPGVDRTAGTNDFGPPGQQTAINGSANGGMGGVQYTLDGGNNVMGLRNTGNPAPNPDAVQEFRVLTNSFDAEYGKYAGGVVNVVTKSGTNEVHGSLFEFLRNDKLNAMEWNATSKDPLRRNQFGGTLGAPVMRNRLFLFASYSGLRQRESAFKRSARVPTAAQRLGDYSLSTVTIRDPLTRAPFPGNRIPANRIDPVARRITDEWVPPANLPGDFVEVHEPQPYANDEGLIRWDAYFRWNHQLAASYFINNGDTSEPLVSSGNLPWTRRVLTWRQQNFNLRETWTAGPATINQFHLGYVRHIGGRLNLPQISLGDLGSKFQIQGTKCLPRITVRGYFTLYTAIAGPKAGSDFYQLKDVLTLVRGRHSLKLGFEQSLEKFYHLTDLDNYGRFDFRDSNTGDGYADFLLGLPREIRQDAPVYKTDSGWYTAAFAQDELRLHSRVMLNFGLRYEIQFPLVDPQNRKNTFVPGARSTVVPTAPVGMLFPGDAGLSRAIIRGDFNNFGPRLGLAWDPFGDGRMAVRAGFGLYYGNMGGNMANGTADRPPFTLRYVFNRPGTLYDPYMYEPGGRSPFPYFYDPRNPIFYPRPISMKARDPYYRWPYTYQMNFTIQRELLRDLSVTGAYVSSLSHKLPTDLDLNYPRLMPGATAANYNQRRPYTDYSDIAMLQSRANGAYHGFQFSFEKRMSRNYSFKGFYTFGKGIEDVDLQDGDRAYPQNSNNYRLDRARTSNDQKHRFVLSAIWRLDYWAGSRALVRRSLNGWTVSAIVSFLGGRPFTVSAGDDVNLDGQANDRANLVGNPRLDPNRPRAVASEMWFNTAAFVRGQPGTEGTAGRNILDAPGVRNVDLGLFREFRLREAWNLQFRAELTNAFNLVSLGTPGSSIGGAAFGAIRSARDMRKAQLGLRLTF